VINDVIHARMTPFKVEEVLAALGFKKSKEEDAGAGASQ